MIEEVAPEKATILLADDDDSFRENFAILLRRHGYECVSASNAASAIKLAKDLKLDALISDINMPGNANLELLEAISQMAIGLPVILLTGSPAVETAARSVGLGAVAYLMKPADTNELLGLLQRSISNFRRLRSVTDNRERLQEWAEELAPIEESLKRPFSVNPTDAMQNYLQVTLRNLMLQLHGLDQSIAAWSQLGAASADLDKFDLVRAVHHTIEVLEKTRQNFRSKDLGELRKQLQTLLPREQPEKKNPPALGTGAQ